MAHPRDRPARPVGRLCVVAAIQVAAAILALSPGAELRAAEPTAPRSSTGPAAVVLVSLDGFRASDLDREEVPALRHLASIGLRAQGLVPVFPSKTFPSHYSLVTGLPPGRNGILSNNMRDPDLGEFHLHDRQAVEDARWWGGEPIWVTAERQGLRTATMFWPGSEAAIGGVRPSEWRRYDGGLSLSDRVETVLGWLAGPAAERPRFVTLYFEEPNETSHAYGPDAPETRAELAEVDARVADLLAGIERLDLAGGVDVVVVSDHGMADVSPERIVFLDDYVALEPGELFDDGALLQLFPGPGRETILYDALAGAHPRLAVYRREELPERWGLAGNPRLPPLLGVPDVGWEVTVRGSARQRSLQDGSLRGDHGQDPADPRMHGLFVAAGPSFRPGSRIGLVNPLDVYPLLAELLGVEPAPNEGELGRLRAPIE